MTREAKIGMLTGLGVIVLIGVLLSEYLGPGTHGPGAGGMAATGRMATLPMGAAYRQEIMQPVGVPSLVRADGATQAPGAGAIVSAAPAAPMAYAAMDASGAPRMDAPVSAAPALNQPVTPVPAGTIQMDGTALPASVPTMQMPATAVQTVYVPGQTAGTPVGAAPATGTVVMDGPAASEAHKSAAPAKPAGQEYVIAAGDNLAKIAKKFYHSSKNSDIERIVAANPAMLKDSKSMLIAGKKLFIPAVAPAANAAVPTPMAVAAAPAKAKTVIRQPGTSGGAVSAVGGSSTTTSTKKTATKTYVVQANDTLEKIAKKFGGNTSETVKKIMAANGIKDAKSLQVGQKLTLPAA
ncbi:MAG TPA: LysM peptidoglycan-binding domain-containing protein [Phycisphaerae bacterium]|nr:LysM peptidoglycan-binding domain-containing protein [Phycisphaerae bacterium]